MLRIPFLKPPARQINPQVSASWWAATLLALWPVGVLADADLSLSKTASGGVKPSGNVVYTIVVNNAGPDPAADVTVADPTPAGLTFVSNQGDCLTAFPCTLGALAAGQTRTITATYSVPARYNGPNPIQNEATVTASTADNTPGNNSSTALTAITRVAGYHTLPPCRVADTRGTSGVPIGGPALAAGAARAFAVRRLCGLPDNAIAVSFNVTVTAPTGAGNLRVYPGGGAAPLASAINYISGQTRANNGIVPMGTNGSVAVQCDQASGSVHFILDVNGYFAATDSVATPVGQSVKVRPAPEVEITFDNVTQAGVTSAAVIEFADNRSGAVDQNLRDFFPPGSPLHALLPDVVVPGFIVPLGKGGPSGPPTFVLSIIDTTAKFTRTAQVDVFEGLRLGWPPPCDVPADRTQEPRIFYAREAPKGEPPLVEETAAGGPVFVNASSGCGSNEGRAWAFSLYLAGRDSRPSSDIAAFMLGKLEDALTMLGSLITNPTVANALHGSVQAAISTLGTNAASSYASLTTFLATIDGNPTTFNNATRNVAGELAGRGLAARHQLGKLAGPAATIVEFPLPTSPDCAIAEGSDGNLWFTSSASNKIGRMTPSGVVTEFLVPTPAARPNGITAGPDGNLWFVEGLITDSKVGRITPVGAITEFPLGGYAVDITAGSDGNLWVTKFLPRATIVRMTPAGTITNFFPSLGFPNGIAAGPDGNVWFTEVASGWDLGLAQPQASGDAIGRITASGVITEFPFPTTDVLGDIVAGPDGNLWFPAGASKIGRSTPSGQITEFSVPTNTGPVGITSGPDGNVWFTGTTANTIGFITPAGAATVFAVPTPNSQPCGITRSSDGTIWFTERNASKIGRITP